MSKAAVALMAWAIFSWLTRVERRINEATGKSN
jgi:hypothetical protein